MSKQNQLFPVTDHADKGKEFEGEIAASNHFYLLRGIIDVVQNPNAWDFAKGRDYWKYKELFEQGDRRAARTGDGRYLMRVYSEVDFSGGGFVFDCKETKGKNFSLDNISDQQIRRLVQSAKCGTTAGIFTKFTELDRAFFVPALYLDERFINWRKASYGARRAPKGVASISIAEMEGKAIEFFRNKVSGIWDWYAVLKK